jgi:ABC-type branched-subunit amino acid transport system ATPase component/ABC-type branched-subunit amino acid transport system permease subunit
MLIALLMAAGFGAFLYLALFRPLRSAPAVAKAVASLGLSVGIQALMAERIGTTPVSTPTLFPKGVVQLSGISISHQVLWLAGIIALVTVGLWAGYKFTRFGLATQAVAETEKGAYVSGLSPDRIALVNWSISAVAGGLAGILISPVAPLMPVSFTLYLVPALAAALVGSFSSIPIAVASGFLIGAANSELGYRQVKHQISWLTPTATASLIPLLLILVYLVVRGRPLPSRGAIVLRTLGRAPRPRNVPAAAAIGAVVGVTVLLVASPTYRGAATTSMIFAIIALSLVVVTGYAGQISLAQLTLAGAGAFALNRLTMNMHVPFPIAPILAACVAMVIGVVVGLPALRIRGLPVAIVTFALSVTLHSFWFQNITLANDGDTTVEPANLFGINLAVGLGRDQNRVAFGVMVLVVLIMTATGVALLRRSTLGSAMLAVRANERSAAASGINVARTKVIAFAIGSFIAGLGGAMLAYQQTRANESSFNPVAGLFIFAIVYLNGVTSIYGAISAGIATIGGFFYVLLNDNFKLGLWYEVVVGGLLLWTIIRNPEGVSAGFHQMMDKYHRRRAGGEAPAPPEAPRRVATAATAGPKVGGEPVLSVNGVTVQYGEVVAVMDASIEVPEGLIVGLIGPNGAGKTTLVDAITGFAPCSGRVSLMGTELEGLAPHQRVLAGLGRTFQGIDLYEDLNILENVMVGEMAARAHHGDTGGPSVEELCRSLGLGDDLERPVGELSQGQRQLVSIARALAGRPKVLLLDEPAGGLDTEESLWLGDRLRAVRDSGVTILLIDHDMHLVLSVCDLIHVLDIGEVIASGPPDAIRRDPKVTAAYLGDSHDAEVGA